jgi:hypothetical protein
LQDTKSEILEWGFNPCSLWSQHKAQGSILYAFFAKEFFEFLWQLVN